MELKFILDKLKEQKSVLDFGVTETWLLNTYQYIEDYFHSYSTRARTFNNLVQEYNKRKTNSKKQYFSQFEFDDIKRKAAGFLTEIISVLEHEYQLQQAAAKNAADNIKKHQENLAKLAATPKQQAQQPIIPQKPIPMPETKIITKTQLPFGIKAEFFWGIMVVIIGFAYWLGSKWENLELRDEVKILKSDTTSKNEKIRDYELDAQRKNIIIDSMVGSSNKITSVLDSGIKN